MYIALLLILSSQVSSLVSEACPVRLSKGENLFDNGNFKNGWAGWILPIGKGTTASPSNYNS